MPSTEKLRAAIDRKVEALEAQKLELHIARNLLSTANSGLPIELLVDIFRYVVPMKSDGTRILHVCEGSCWKSVLTISHVCNHWRTVTLSTLSLWTQCTPPNSYALQAYLDRSPGLPIIPDISFNRMSWKSVRPLLSQLHRARGFRIDLCGRFGFHGNTRGNKEARVELEQSLGNLSQLLEHLVVCGGWLDGERNRGVIPCLKANVDENRFPNLRHLYVSDAMIDPGCCALRNLHTLVLHGGFQSEALSLSGDQFLDILEACPEIEKLEVSEVSWTHDSTAHPIPKQPTSLSCLRSARLVVFDHEFDIIMKMLYRFSFPAEAKVWMGIHTFPGEFTEPELDNFTVQILLEAALLALRPSEQPLSRFGIVCKEEFAGLFGSISGSQGSLHLVACRRRGAPGLAIEIVDRLLNQDLSHLVALEINLAGTEMISKEWWCALFARTPELRQLSLGSKDELMSGLTALESIDPTISKSSSTPLPHLAELFLWDKDIPELCLDPVLQRNYLDDQNSPAHYLIKCLTSRKDCGCLLEKLTISTSTPTNLAQPNLIEGIVQYVTIVNSRSYGVSLFLLSPMPTWIWEKI